MPDFHVTFRDLLDAVNLRHGTNGFTSLPKGGVLRIFSPWKFRRLRPGLNPRTWVPKASKLPLDHRRRLQQLSTLETKNELTNWLVIHIIINIIIRTQLSKPSVYFTYHQFRRPKYFIFRLYKTLMCFVLFLQQSGIIHPHSINWSGFTAKTLCVYSVVGKRSLWT